MAVEIVIILIVWLIGIPVALGQMLYWFTSTYSVLRKGDIPKLVKLSFFSWAIYIVYLIEKIYEYLEDNR